MDIFGATIPGNANLQHLNTVQLYLGVATLAETTNNEGTAIIAWTLSGENGDNKLSLGQTKKNQDQPAGEYGDNT
eukprot:15327239-Ditylum_brightwellii.AAC.1